MAATKKSTTELSTAELWKLYKGRVVADACKLYQKDKLKTAEDISNFLAPITKELQDAIAIAIGLGAADPKDKVIDLILEGHSLAKSRTLFKDMTHSAISVAEVKSLIMAHQSEYEQWQQESLQDRFYPVVYLDAIPISFKEGTTGSSQKNFIYTAIGLNMTGHKELISFLLDPALHDKSVPDFLKTLKQRGLTDPPFFCGSFDGSFDQSMVAEVFPNSNYIPNMKDFISYCVKQSPSDRAPLNKYLTAIYKAKTKRTVNYNIAHISALSFFRFNPPLSMLISYLEKRFIPEVADVLVTVPTALRKLLNEGTTFSENFEQMKTFIKGTGFTEAAQLNTILYLYSQRVLRKKMQRALSNWSTLESELEECPFSKNMLPPQKLN